MTEGKVGVEITSRYLCLSVRVTLLKYCNLAIVNLHDLLCRGSLNNIRDKDSTLKIVFTVSPTALKSRR